MKAFEAEPRKLCLSVFIPFVWGVKAAHGLALLIPVPVEFTIRVLTRTYAHNFQCESCFFIEYKMLSIIGGQAKSIDLRYKHAPDADWRKIHSSVSIRSLRWSDTTVLEGVTDM